MGDVFSHLVVSWCHILLLEVHEGKSESNQYTPFITSLIILLVFVGTNYGKLHFWSIYLLTIEFVLFQR